MFTGEGSTGETEALARVFHFLHEDFSDDQLNSLAFAMAAGKVAEVPFSAKLLEEGRRIFYEGIASEDDSWEAFNVIETGQHFLEALRLIQRSAQHPDWECVQFVKGGVTLGGREQLPRTPAVFEESLRGGWTSFAQGQYWRQETTLHWRPILMRSSGSLKRRRRGP